MTDENGNHAATPHLIATSAEAIAERDRLKALNAELVEALETGLGAAKKLDKAHDIVTQTGAEQAVHNWANQARAALAKARLIAAAPKTAQERDRLKALNAELVEALEAIANHELDITGAADMAKMARAALVKARE